MSCYSNGANVSNTSLMPLTITFLSDVRPVKESMTVRDHFWNAALNILPFAGVRRRHAMLLSSSNLVVICHCRIKVVRLTIRPMVILRPELDATLAIKATLYEDNQV